MKNNFKMTNASEGQSVLKRLVFRALFFAALGSGSIYAQTFTESMGTVAGTTTIAAQEAANGFDNVGFTMTGNADVRITNASSGYAGASGAANIFFTSTASRNFQIEGINSSSIANPVLSFGIWKADTASNGSDMKVEVSSDGINYSALSFSALPTGAGTAIWHYRTASGTIPQVANLRIRFTNLHTSSYGFRIDDVKLTCSAVITPSASTTLCSGGSVDLTANSGVGGSYAWSDSETTQSISVSNSGTFTVQVTDGTGCVATSAPVRVLAYPAANVSVTASDDTICVGDSVTLTVRTLATDLFFSEYVEGSGNEKYVEIYNGTGATVNLADYQYLAFHNGISTPSFIINLTGSLADGATLVLKNGSATLYSGGTAEYGLQPDGNDAFALYNVNTGLYVDIFGVIGQDPGTAWTGSSSYSTQDKTLRRKSNVYSGITVNPDLAGASGFTTLNSEWDLYSTDDVSGLGAHTMDGAYSWSPATVPASGSPVKAAPSSATTYTVTGTYVNGCTGDATVTVVVTDCGGRKAAPANEGMNIASADAYPNPFNGSVSIQLNAPVAGPATVTVKDVTGRIVATLYNGEIAEGQHIISWTPDAAQISNGVYFCEIKIGGESQTIKLMYQQQ